MIQNEKSGEWNGPWSPKSQTELHPINSAVHSPEDKWYWDAIEQYRGNESLYNYLASNPYLRGNNAVYSPTLLDSFARIFGSTSGEDSYYEDLRSKANGFLSDALRGQYEQQYDSPVEQSKRLMAAGINPSLQSGSVSAGSAAENDQAFSPASMSAGQDNGIAGLASFFVQIYSLASGFAKDSLALQQMENTITDERVGVAKNITDLAEQYIMTRQGPASLDDTGHVILPDLSLDSLDDYTKLFFRSNKERKRFKAAVNQSYASARIRAKQFTNLKEYEDSKYAFVNSFSRNSSYGDEHTLDLDPLTACIDTLTKMQKDLTEYSTKYERNFYKQSDGALAGEAANAANSASISNSKAQVYQNGVNEIINRNMEGLMQQLDNTAKGGSTLERLIAKGMMLFISVYRLNVLPALPSINLKGMIQNTTENKSFNKFEMGQ